MDEKETLLYSERVIKYPSIDMNEKYRFLPLITKV